ncbi:hypothetical protein Cni_G08759 [Canna indica]|uniref:Uncharacterized protein n=1 Tax=Canna indica TaxID=4628 RepID=A0AAQ3Q864_9LILI|nr:hypothetical protein Cni_G08759 [Canna indica]
MGCRGDNNASLQIKPYPREYDTSAMAKDRPLNLTAVHGNREAPRCTVNHTVPDIVFSTGGHWATTSMTYFAGVLVPLFKTIGTFLGQLSPIHHLQVPRLVDAQILAISDEALCVRCHRLRQRRHSALFRACYRRTVSGKRLDDRRIEIHQGLLHHGLRRAHAERLLVGPQSCVGIRLNA